jgi:fucose permease
MSTATQRNVLILSCLIFLSLGIVFAVIGPLLPELAQNNNVNLAAIGSVFTALFLGSILSQLFSGPLSDRVGQMPVLFGAALLLAAGSLGFILSRSLGLTLALVFCAGLGSGAVDLSTNVLIARVYPKRSVSALNLLNLFFGVGAFVGPAMVGIFLGRWGSGLPVIWIVAGLLILQSIFILRIRATLRLPQSQDGDQDRPPIYRSPLVWMLGLVLLLYVGAESGIGGWVTTYMDRTTPMRYEQATLIASGFWLALTIGRLVSVFLGLRLSANRVLALSLGGSFLGGILMAAGSGNQSLTIASVLLTGFCFGSVFPTVISLTTEAFPNAPGRAVSVVAAMGSVGGMLIPWMQGLLLEQVSALSSMIFVTIAIGLMLVVFMVVRYIPALVKLRTTM